MEGSEIILEVSVKDDIELRYNGRMRTVKEALDYVDTLTLCCLERPEMYAWNPESLEGILSLLDNLAAFLRSNDDRPILVRRSRYTEFIVSKGLGAMGFAHRHPVDSTIDEHSRVAFQPLCDFWREYLSVRDLPAPFPEFPYE
jgi:hypothetical protein